MKIKVLLFSTFLFLSFNIFADYNLRVSYDFLYNEQLSDTPLNDGSYAMYAEYYIEPIDKVSIGLGAAYSWPAEYKTVPAGLNSNPIDSSIPIFGTVILSILPDSNIEPYIIGRLGINIINANKNSNAKNVQGDMFSSIGFGGYYNDFFLEGTYDKSAGYYTLTTKRETLNYTHFSLRFGYQFNFRSNKQVKLYDSQKEFVKPKETQNFDNLEKFDSEGNIIEKVGTYQDLQDLQLIE